MHASGYLDGEPAKAVLEVQRSLVSAEGNGVLGVQPLKLLLVVDHKNLPENTLVRCSEKNLYRGQEKSWRKTQYRHAWAVQQWKERFACHILAFLQEWEGMAWFPHLCNSLPDV